MIITNQNCWKKNWNPVSYMHVSFTFAPGTKLVKVRIIDCTTKVEQITLKTEQIFQYFIKQRWSITLDHKDCSTGPCKLIWRPTHLCQKLKTQIYSKLNSSGTIKISEPHMHHYKHSCKNQTVKSQGIAWLLLSTNTIPN